MNNAVAANRNRRRIRYIDAGLQRWLIVGLSLIQVFTVSLALWYLDTALREVLESNLYRVHLRPGSDVQAFAGSMMRAFALLLLISTLALLFVDWLWSSHLNGALSDLRILARRTRDLDLVPDPLGRGSHELLDRLHAWRAHERQLCSALRDQLDGLQSGTGVSTDEVNQRLAEMRRLLASRLPHASS